MDSSHHTQPGAAPSEIFRLAETDRRRPLVLSIWTVVCAAIALTLSLVNRITYPEFGGTMLAVAYLVVYTIPLLILGVVVWLLSVIWSYAVSQKRLFLRIVIIVIALSLLIAFLYFLYYNAARSGVVDRQIEDISSIESYFSEHKDELLASSRPYGTSGVRFVHYLENHDLCLEIDFFYDIGHQQKTGHNIPFAYTHVLDEDWYVTIRLSELMQPAFDY